VAPADGSLDLDGGVLTSHGDFDAIIARLRPGGEVVWARGFGGPGFDLVKALDLDAADGVLAVGPLQRPADYGDEPPFFAGGFDAYLARHAAGGALVWKNEIVSDDSVQAHDVTVDDAGGIWVSGHFRGTVQIGGRSLQASGGTDAWGAIFGSDGRVRWASAFGGDGDELSYAVATDSRSIVIAGAFEGRTSLCGQVARQSRRNGRLHLASASVAAAALTGPGPDEPSPGRQRRRQTGHTACPTCVPSFCARCECRLSRRD
jgi:hypothetical protein